jgi:hypothetical protein
MSLANCGVQTLSPGDEDTLRILARVDPGTPPETILTTTATVSANPPDLDPSDNVHTVDVTVGEPGTGSPPRYTLIADYDTTIPDGQGTFTGFDPPVISDGYVAFTAYVGNNDSIHRWVDGTLTTIADRNTLIPGGEGTFWLLGDFGLGYSVSGPQVASHTYSGASRRAIYVTDACGFDVAITHSVPCPSDPASNFNFLWGPQIRDGSIVFDGGAGSGANGIYRWDGSTVHIVIDNNTRSRTVAVTSSLSPARCSTARTLRSGAESTMEVGRRSGAFTQA